MAWTLFRLPGAKKTELEELLKEDQLSRQSQKVRDAASVGGPSGELYVLIEGGAPAIAHAESLLSPIATKVGGADGQALYKKFKDEEENASSGMGLFFTEE
ncbi:MAG: hypothetical protein L3K09_08590 [Thermoplasmata archaeon]|nr:hypothetical protein [Thermoplasmata archaeon]